MEESATTTGGAMRQVFDQSTATCTQDVEIHFATHGNEMLSPLDVLWESQKTEIFQEAGILAQKVAEDARVMSERVVMKMRYGIVVLSIWASPAFANEPLQLRETWEGRVSSFMTGVPMAYDTNNNQRADKLILPAVVQVPASAVPAGVTMRAARLYWGGTQTQDGADCVGSQPDREVQISRPDGAVRDIVADRCYCSGADAGTYDLWICHTDITSDAGDAIVGQWSIDGYEGLIADGSTDAASAAFLFVYEKDDLPPRSVALFDGNYVLANDQVTFRLDVNVDTNPDGDLTYFVIEGDTAGEGEEFVRVDGTPGNAGPLTLSDDINPANNPFNRTINTTVPPRTGVVGVDVDRFDITAALTAGDTGVNATYSAGEDKVWLAVNVLGVNLFDPVLTQKSFKAGTLLDQDGNNVPSPGDTIRYEIHLENTGNEAATVNVTDTLSDSFSSWTLVGQAPGFNASNPTTLMLNNVVIEPGQFKKIILDAILGDVPDQTLVSNTAAWSQPTEGGSPGDVTAEELLVRRDGDGDGVFDNDDNCPDLANPDQADLDENGIGDACEEQPDMGMPDMTTPDVDMEMPVVETFVSGTGCAAAPGSSAGFGWLIAGLLGLVGLLRRRQQRECRAGQIS